MRPARCHPPLSRPSLLRRHAGPAALALAALAWLGLTGFAWNDYDDEARAAVAALVRGDVAGFVDRSPAYGGSFVLRAPFALAAHALGGGELAVYRALAVPCLLASGLLAVWLAGRMRAAGRSPLAWVTALGLIAASPLTIRALEIGHPEELLGAALCVGAVVLAARGRPLLGATLAGAAVANKPWALLAFPLVLALADGRRARVLAVVALATLAVAVPFLVAGGGGVGRASTAGAHTGAIFQPWQAWWFVGRHGEVVRGVDGQVKSGYRSPPSWLSWVTRPLILLAAPALTLLWWRRRRRPTSWEDALALLALIFLVRCLLDPWNTIYYVIPALFALVAWEGLTRREPPLLGMLVTVATWTCMEWLPGRVSADAQALLYLAWSVPLVAGLALRIYAPDSFVRLADASRLLARGWPSARRAPTSTP